MLIDRSEYWIVYKNFHDSKDKHLSVADELCFRVNEHTGNLGFSINGITITDCLFNVDTTQKLWFFFDLCGKISGIRLIQCCSSNEPEQSISSLAGHLEADSSNRHLLVTSTPKIPSTEQRSNKRRSRPNSALIEFYRNQFNYEDLREFQSERKPDDNKNKAVERKKSIAKEECRICWENPIECVLYSCGHMCLCWTW